jgi:hypothetical protein
MLNEKCAWKNGMMEYWVEKKVFPLLTIIPTFHYSGRSLKRSF